MVSYKANRIIKKFRSNIISKAKPLGRGLERIDRKMRAELYIKGYGYLRQDVGIKGVSSKVIALKITNPNKKDMPYEHLTFKRINSVL